jgi:pyruvate/2-oxoglutarate dehydrogenase complex dihydrolipoamide acyltransferase (E2) component
LSKVSFILILINFLEVGQQVQADEVIARIETDKVTVDILSKYAGVITKYHAAEGDTVAVGAKFVDIDPAATPGAAPA